MSDGHNNDPSYPTFNSVSIPVPTNANPNPGDDFPDFNQDGVVDAADYITLKTHFGGAGAFEDGDADRDGKVGWGDLQILISHCGESSPSGAAPSATTPEPASLALLLAGGAVLLRRRGLARPCCSAVPVPAVGSRDV